jgi:hypothetical protein
MPIPVAAWSAAVRLLVLVYVFSCECCVLSGIGLITRPGEFYLVWSVCGWSQSPVRGGHGQESEQKKVYSICIHKNCDQNTKKKIISNLLLQVLPYAISLIAHSDHVFGKQIFLFISWNVHSFFKVFHHSINYRLPERRSPPTNATHHNLNFNIPPRKSIVNFSVSTKPRPTVSTSPVHCLLVFFSPYFFSKLFHTIERKPSLQNHHTTANVTRNKDNN